MYRLSRLMYGETVPSSVTRLSDKVCIPFNPDNTDYQQYLAWLEEGNTPQEADE